MKPKYEYEFESYSYDAVLQTVTRASMQEFQAKLLEGWEIVSATLTQSAMESALFVTWKRANGS